MACVRRFPDLHNVDAVPDPRKPENFGPASTGQVLGLEVRRPDPHSVVIDVAGEVDLATAPDLQTLVTWSLQNTPAQLIIDLSQVTFFAAAGLNVLVRARLDAQRREKRLQIVTGGSGSVMRALRAGGLDSCLPVCSEGPHERLSVPRTAC